jgi:hypothetical protein
MHHSQSDSLSSNEQVDPSLLWQWLIDMANEGGPYESRMLMAAAMIVGDAKLRGVCICDKCDGRAVQPPVVDGVKHYEQRLRDLMRYTSHNPSCEFINRKQTWCSCGYAALAAIVLAEVGPPSTVSTKSASPE